MSRELPFIVLCIEEYKNQKNLNGKAVIELFKKHSVIDYITNFYESLHTTSISYVINDIDEYIKNAN